MRKQMPQFLLPAVVVLATWLPVPAAAEMLGTAACASPSWNALVSGECGIRGVHLVEQPRQGEPDGSTQLVTAPDTSPLIPEPETYALMLVGLIAVIVAARRRRRD